MNVNAGFIAIGNFVVERASTRPSSGGSSTKLRDYIKKYCDNQIVMGIDCCVAFLSEDIRAEDDSARPRGVMPLSKGRELRAELDKLVQENPKSCFVFFRDWDDNRDTVVLPRIEESANV